jgi:ubiquinone/menaquinone biosynthesis C-methylase UbiE
MSLTPHNNFNSSAQSNDETSLDKATRSLRAKYEITSWVYDVLDYPWERQYRQWRPSLLQDLSGRVLEVGVGTGRNLQHYTHEAQVVGVDLSPAMLSIARKRMKQAVCDVSLLQNDATRLSNVQTGQFDWYVATFLYCVLPDELQPLALGEMVRVLKPGGRFRILEIVYSKDPRLFRRQQRLARLVEMVYGARFDRQTLRFLQQNNCVEISETRFLKADTYLLIEGYKKKPTVAFSSCRGGATITPSRQVPQKVYDPATQLDN